MDVSDLTQMMPKRFTYTTILGSGNSAIAPQGPGAMFGRSTRNFAVRKISGPFKVSNTKYRIQSIPWHVNVSIPSKHRIQTNVGENYERAPQKKTNWKVWNLRQLLENIDLPQMAEWWRSTLSAWQWWTHTTTGITCREEKLTRGRRMTVAC